jgi:hydroxymethylpyrimidine pyrophosphatase-like HAD family hydrolase
VTDTETPSPRRRAVFLDVDGTYAVFGAAPAGHVAAVRAARDAGHLVFLCTGRPMSMVPAHLLAAGFDGVVAAGGAYAVLGDEVLLDIRFPADLAARTVEVMDSYGVTYLLEAPEAVYTASGTVEQLRQAYRAHLADAPSATTVVSDILASVRPVPTAGAVSFAKVSVVVSSVPVEQLGAEVGEQLAVLPSSVPALGEEAGEIFLADVHKAVGMEDAIVRRLGLARDGTSSASATGSTTSRCSSMPVSASRSRVRTSACSRSPTAPPPAPRWKAWSRRSLSSACADLLRVRMAAGSFTAVGRGATVASGRPAVSTQLGLWKFGIVTARQAKPKSDQQRL